MMWLSKKPAARRDNAYENHIAQGTIHVGFF